MSDQTYTIVGAGAIGGIVGAKLWLAGHPVRFIEANAAHARAIRENGLHLSGRETLVAHPEVLMPEDLAGQLDQKLTCVFVAVKSGQTQSALEMIEPYLSPDSMVVSLQNGLESLAIADRLGADRTLAASFTLSGFFESPGKIMFGSTGTFRVGELNGKITPRLTDLVRDLNAVQTVTATPNILGCIWAKISLGAVFFATALADADVLDILDDGDCLDLFAGLVGEVVAVSGALGIATEPFDGFVPAAFRPDIDRDDAAIAEIWQTQRAYWQNTEQRRTGIWRDLAIHKRKTEFEELMGKVISLARAKNINVPVLVDMHARYNAVENENAALGWHHLHGMIAVQKTAQKSAPRHG